MNHDRGYSIGLVLAAGGVFFLGVALYYRDVKFSKVQDQAEFAIGQLTEVESEVTRKPPARLLWLPMNQSDLVYERDAIRTGPDSSVRIQLNNQSEIDLQPDSLVVLETEQKNLTVKVAKGDLLLKGTIRAKLSDTLEIVSNDKNSQASLQKSGDGYFNVQSNKGSLTLLSGLESKTIQKGSQARINAAESGGKIEVKQFPFIRQEPIDGQKLLVERGRELNFKIESNGDYSGDTPENIVLVISTDKSFKKNRTEVPWSIGSSLKAQLKEGHYYWKLIRGQNKEDYTSVGSFAVEWPQQLSWLNVSEDGVALTYQKEGVDLHLRWKSVRGVKNYGLKFYAGDELIESLQVSRNEWSSARQKNKLWEYLQKEGLQKQGNFRVQLSASLNSQAEVTAIEAKLRVMDDRLPEAPLNFRVEASEDNDEIALRWDLAKDNASLSFSEVIIGNMQYQKKILETEETKLVLKSDQLYQATLNTKDSPKIRVQGANGKWSSWAELKGFDREKFALAHFISKPPQALYPSEQSRIIPDKESVEFSWDFQANQYHQPEGFELVLFDVKNNKKTIHKADSNTMKVATPRSGQYKWQVRSVWKNEQFSPYSLWRSFDVLKPKALEPPKLRIPASIKQKEMKKRSR